MKTTQEKLNQIYKGCDKIVDELTYVDCDEYELGFFDLAELILEVIEEN